MKVAPVTGIALLSASVPPAWSNVGALRHRQGGAAPDRETAIVDDLAAIVRVAPAAIVTLPWLTTWPLMVAGPPVAGLTLTLPSAALVRAPEVIARVSP